MWTKFTANDMKGIDISRQCCYPYEYNIVHFRRHFFFKKAAFPSFRLQPVHHFPSEVLFLESPQGMQNFKGKSSIWSLKLRLFSRPIFPLTTLESKTIL